MKSRRARSSSTPAAGSTTISKSWRPGPVERSRRSGANSIPAGASARALGVARVEAHARPACPATTSSSTRPWRASAAAQLPRLSSPGTRKSASFDSRPSSSSRTTPKTFGVKHPEYPKAQARVEEIQSQIAATRASIAQRVEAEYRQAANRETMLEQAVKETKAEFDNLNARSFEYQSLKREAESDKKLYEELVRKIKEAGINASFQNSSIRIADAARPGLKPVFPRTWLNVLLAFLFASFIGVGAAVLGDVLDNTVRDPDQVARLMKTDVIGSLPAVKDWRRRLSPIPTHGAAAHCRRHAQRQRKRQW